MPSDSTPSVRVMQLTWVYNEADILPWSIRHSLEQGIDLHILDNWSDDGSYDIARSFAIMYPNRVYISRLPVERPTKVSWADMLQTTEGLAAEQWPEYSWFIHQDADEFTRPEDPNETIPQAIARLDRLGYNAIDHEMNIMASRDGWDGMTDPSIFFADFCDNIEPHRAERNREVKVWKQPKGQRVDLVHNGGHTVRFPGVKVAPERFVKYHYSMRGKEHAERKIASRMSRWSDHDLKERRWHTHMPRMYEECVASRA